jgi:hypothetical protein
MNWDDVNVLRNLPDGWYSVPSNSKYGEMINKYPDVRYNDSVEKARERHDRILEKEREMDDFIKSESLRDKSKICTHKNFYYKGYLICEVCGLAEQGFDPFDFSESDRVMSRMCGKDDRMCGKARVIIMTECVAKRELFLGDLRII